MNPNLSTDSSIDALTRQVEDARGLVVAGRTEEAIVTFASLVEQWPDVHELCVALCSLLFVAGRSDPKPAWIRGAVRHNPSLVETFHETAMSLHGTGDLDGARHFLEGLVTCDPTHSDLLNDLGIVQFELGDMANAETTLRLALLSNPEHVEARRALAHVFAKTDRVGQARTLCENVPGLIEDVLPNAPIGDKVHVEKIRTHSSVT